jgi:hypothetical protein
MLRRLSGDCKVTSSRSQDTQTKGQGNPLCLFSDGWLSIMTERKEEPMAHTDKIEGQANQTTPEAAAYQAPEKPLLSVRIPGFVSDEQIGLGDVVSRVTYGFGIKPCGGCGRRAAALNRMVVFRR